MDPAKILKHIEVTGEALSLFAKAAEDACGREALALQNVPKIASALKEAGLIDAEDVTLARQQLSDHATALDVLGNVLDQYKQAAAAATEKSASFSLGRGEESSSYTPKTSNYVGRREGSYEPVQESDLALLRLIGKA